MKHWIRQVFPRWFFTRSENQRIIQAIRKAEHSTSGEIRVHLERHAHRDVLSHAQTIFNKIGMTNTRERNGVLIYIALSSKKFAVIGDQAIHEKVGQEFWDSTAAIITDFFKRGEFAAGIERAVLSIGEQLKLYFPYQSGDQNELSDQISNS